ncbi:hypothetical protein NHQ30_005299 [Ciborinia camelliae]|nr:hypothetical protein NHQ30_005299 [Ciborinia camelliae]
MGCKKSTLGIKKSALRKIASLRKRSHAENGRLRNRGASKVNGGTKGHGGAEDHRGGAGGPAEVRTGEVRIAEVVQGEDEEELSEYALGNS